VARERAVGDEIERVVRERVAGDKRERGER